MTDLFFHDWETIIRAFIVTLLSYAALIFIIRISGKRTLAKMNAFDFIVTIALGSCLASIALDKKIAIAEGVTVYATLIGLQFLITFLSVRYRGVKTFVSGQPILLLYDGKTLDRIMKKERITIDEIYLAARSNGAFTLDEIEVVVLETTGDLTVILKENKVNKTHETLQDVIKPV